APEFVRLRPARPGLPAGPSANDRLSGRSDHPGVNRPSFRASGISVVIGGRDVGAVLTRLVSGPGALRDLLSRPSAGPKARDDRYYRNRSARRYSGEWTGRPCTTRPGGDC